MSVKRFFEATLVLALLILINVPAFPQSSVSLGTIEGTIKDTTGAVLPGASVSILNSATGFSRRVVTALPTRVLSTPLPPTLSEF